MKKAWLVIALALLIAVFLAGCVSVTPDGGKPNVNTSSSGSNGGVSNGNAGGSNENSGEGNGILVAYFSCTGSTEGIAEKIASASGGELYEIVPELAYTSADLNYNDNSSRANKEQSDSAARPAIKGELPDTSNYEIVFLGYPIWWGKLPKIVYTFLESCDLRGKTVVPFCTSGSTGIEGS